MDALPEQIAAFERVKGLGLTPAPVEDQPYGVEHHTADGVFVKQIVIPRRGTIVPTHKHAWSHTTMVAKGAVLVWRDGELDGRVDAPTGILVKAGVGHAFQALEDDTILYCIHGDSSEEAQAVLKAYNLEIGAA